MGGFRGFLVLLLFVVATSAQLPSQDILALLEFKKGIKHDPTGYISDSWNEESIDFNGCPASWNGIVCSGGNVAGVVLDNLELPEFEYAYDLEVLRLGNNAFSGLLPNGLLKGDALVLRELDLSANNLSGQISWITSTTLQVLNLSSNSISGALPLLTGGCTVLDLSKNQFTGNLSVIVKWGDEIEYIDLSHNQLAGPIPYLTSQLPSGVQSSTGKSNLQVLNLSGNHFNGSFPDDLGSLTAIQVLDISANDFSGPLPSTVSKLISLAVLDLSQNQFTGPLPSTLPNTLISFNASYNDLSGVVPVNLRKFPDSSFHPGNARLVLPGVPPSTPSSDNTPSGNHSNKPIRTYIKVAVIVACVVGVVIIILLAIILHYRIISRTPHSDKVTDKNGERTLPDTSGGKERLSGGTLMVSADDLIAARKGTSSEMMIPEEKLAAAAGYSPSKNSRFSWSPDSGEAFAENLGRLDVRSPDRLAGDLYFLDETITLTPEELSRAPAEVLGRSSHGTSYRATLDNGVLLTVKWLREGVAKQKKEFQKEAKKFANIRHPNVVGLRGYYWGPTQHEKLILSDYISPGSLASFLYDRPGRKGPPLTWAQRLKIAVDVARGLNYLHFDRAVPHGNLKATNILLDGLDLNARVADYCLYRLMTQAGTVEQINDAGVLGYRAPELAASKKPSPSFKSDMYAFGVVILELLTGRCAGDVVSGDEGGVDLTDWVRLRVAEGRGSECFDSAMAFDIANPAASKGMKEMLGIALRFGMGVKLQALRNFDAFPRAEEHLLQKTKSGAVVSVIGLTIMAILFIHELNYYLTTYTVHQMSVDLKRGETLPIHINMTFPSLPCEVLSVDAIDMSGKHEVDLDTNIWKLRLNKEGQIIGTEYLSDLVEKEHSTHKHDEDKDHHEESSEKKHEHGLNSDAEETIKNVKNAMEKHEGCRVYGVLDVQRVAGNFHISVHGLSIFVAQQIFGGAAHVNVSHMIHDLSFGPKFPGIHNPLDGTVRVLHDTSGTFKYYIKVVPTEYRFLSKDVLPTNQFSVTEYFVPIRETDRSWPAVYFLYDLSPITVTIKEERRSFLHFITRLCAVLGGTFALTGMLDRWMFRLIETFTKPRARSSMR
ncbi:hypothetical protein J5N97_008708 [Dioscorea zingiberensis]|uniref:Protein kinase domain-containing protein n=1 Tax=Dioscorea zingiberensis TaxID=325984 RepID=A0A9D5CXZ3_9LILI|nr:hypothetical protein J5N97_008708 [Dioscorea zingiberensis]